MQLNKQISIEMPQGTISESGINLINAFIASQDLKSPQWQEKNPDTQVKFLAHLPDNWDWQWKITGRGEYVGTFPKRVSKYLYQERGIKAPTDFLQELGNLARQHSGNQKVYTFEIVDNLDWNAGDFGDRNSCLWGGRSNARQIMMENGGQAIRFYQKVFRSEGNYMEGYARAWLQPLEDNLYIIYNGYGETTLTIARILATHLGLVYKKIALRNNGSYGGTIYINNGGYGYLIGTSEQLATITRYDLKFQSETQCSDCGDDVDPDDHYTDNHGNILCEHCYDENYRYCEWCNETYHYEDSTYVERHGDICDNCLDRNFTYCESCDEYHRNQDIYAVQGTAYCEDCAMENAAPCETCEEWYELDNLTHTDDGYYCKDCKPTTQD